MTDQTTIGHIVRSKKKKAGFKIFVLFSIRSSVGKVFKLEKQPYLSEMAQMVLGVYL